MRSSIQSALDIERSILEKTIPAGGPFSTDHSMIESNAWSCRRPSLSEQFPDEAQIEKEFSLSPHSAGKERRLEFFTPEIRDALGCKKDFERKDCTL